MGGQPLFIERGEGAVVEESRVAIVSNRVGTMFTVFFADHPITHWATAKTADTKRFGAFFRAMLRSCVYLVPSQFEAGFMSAAHGDHEIEITTRAAEEALKSI